MLIENLNKLYSSLNKLYSITVQNRAIHHVYFAGSAFRIYKFQQNSFTYLKKTIFYINLFELMEKKYFFLKKNAFFVKKKYFFPLTQIS